MGEMHIVKLEERLMRAKGFESVADVDDLIFKRIDCPPSLVRVRKNLGMGEAALSQANPLWHQAKELADNGERSEETREKIVELCMTAIAALDMQARQADNPE